MEIGKETLIESNVDAAMTWAIFGYKDRTCKYLYRGYTLSKNGYINITDPSDTLEYIKEQLTDLKTICLAEKNTVVKEYKGNKVEIFLDNTQLFTFDFYGFCSVDGCDIGNIGNTIEEVMAGMREKIDDPKFMQELKDNCKRIREEKDNENSLLQNKN